MRKLIVLVCASSLMGCATTQTDYEVCEGVECAEPVDIEVE